MPHYLIGILSYHDADFDEKPLHEFMWERHCRTLVESHGGQTFDLIETAESRWEVFSGVASRLAPNDQLAVEEIAPHQVPADTQDEAGWVKARGGLETWTPIP